VYILRPHSRATGNFVASPRSPGPQKTRSIAKFSKLGARHEGACHSLRGIYSDHKRNTRFTGNRESRRPQ